jgi:hypothetical protein
MQTARDQPPAGIPLNVTNVGRIGVRNPDGAPSIAKSDRRLLESKMPIVVRVTRMDKLPSVLSPSTSRSSILI